MGLSFFLHILLVVGVGLLFYLFSSYLHSSCWREVKLYMGTSFGDAVFFRCRARWWGLFKNIDVKNPALQFFFSSPPIRRRRECKGARGRKEKGIYLRSTLDRVSFQQKVFFFLLAPASMWIAPAFPLWLFYIKLQFARLDSCFPTRLGIPEWLTAIYLGTGLPILAYPDRAPIQSSSCIWMYWSRCTPLLTPYEIACSYLTLHCPVFWDLIFFPLRSINTGDHFAL